jgi:hypothetical protein
VSASDDLLSHLVLGRADTVVFLGLAPAMRGSAAGDPVFAAVHRGAETWTHVYRLKRRGQGEKVEVLLVRVISGEAIEAARAFCQTIAGCRMEAAGHRPLPARERVAAEMGKSEPLVPSIMPGRKQEGIIPLLPAIMRELYFPFRNLLRIFARCFPVAAATVQRALKREPRDFGRRGHETHRLDRRHELGEHGGLLQADQ